MKPAVCFQLLKKIMKHYEICFYSAFSCAMGDCPNTCCKGWRIVFDEETYHRYLNEPGKNGRRLRSAIKKTDGDVYFRDSVKRCVFYERSGLCSLQRTVGTAYMPQVCRIYPRFRQHYGSFAEETLFLSCPSAARLFLEHLDELTFVESGREVDYERWGTNEDEAYLSWLCELREALIGALWDEKRSRGEIFGQLLAAMRDVQARCIEGKTLPAPAELLRAHEGAKAFHIGAATTDKLMTCGFYHSRLKRVSPRLYELCRLYFRTFDRLSAAQADARADALVCVLHRNVPHAEHVLRGYIVYYIQMVFLEVYEDYSFIKKLACGMMHVHMLQLLLALHFEQTGSLADGELALLLSVYERRGRHNGEIAESMYEILYGSL